MALTRSTLCLCQSGTEFCLQGELLTGCRPRLRRIIPGFWLEMTDNVRGRPDLASCHRPLTSKV